MARGIEEGGSPDGGAAGLWTRYGVRPGCKGQPGGVREGLRLSQRGLGGESRGGERWWDGAVSAGMCVRFESGGQIQRGRKVGG